MCGRYTIGTEIDNIRYREIIDKVNTEAFDDKNVNIRTTGDVFPGDVTPIICTIGMKVRGNVMKWGMHAGGKCIINARSETAADKPLFRNSFASMRCIIPAMGYYEWNSRKEKYIFRDPDGEALMMAGLYRIGEDGKREYVILTREAYGSAAEVHGRMPLILRNWNDWLCEPRMTGNMLAAGSNVKLDMECLSPRQLSMF